MCPLELDTSKNSDPLHNTSKLQGNLSTDDTDTEQKFNAILNDWKYSQSFDQLRQKCMQASFEDIKG